jgi:hypothetical protein
MGTGIKDRETVDCYGKKEFSVKCFYHVDF